jgi:hypothetical protein
LAHSRVLADLHAVAGKPGAERRAIKLAERHNGDMDDIPVAMAEESLDENLAGVFESQSLHTLIERAHQHDSPEAIDRASRLAVSEKPVEKGRVVVGPGAEHGEHSAGDAEFLEGGEVMRAEQCAREMEWCRPRVGLEDAPPAIGGEKVEDRLGGEQLSGPDGVEEMGEVGATAHAHVLASIHELAGRGVGE